MPNLGLFVLLGLLLLPQVYAFGAGSMFFYTTNITILEKKLTIRYRFDFRGRRQKLAAWRY